MYSGEGGWAAGRDVRVVPQVQGQVPWRVQTPRRVSHQDTSSCYSQPSNWELTDNIARKSCTYCGAAIEDYYPPLGIVLAVILFPIGLSITRYIHITSVALQDWSHAVFWKRNNAQVAIGCQLRENLKLKMYRLPFTPSQTSFTIYA